MEQVLDAFFRDAGIISNRRPEAHISISPARRRERVSGCLPLITIQMTRR